jgi:lipopolysaccharide export system permease protein
MKIFFRYLFLRLLVPFLVCLCACTLIWVMADLYGNIDDFLEHKVGLMLILRFYSLQIPSMLVQVLPAALLFSTLWTLISLNRRCELVAFQSGGMAPIWLFSPFICFAFIWIAVLAVDMNSLSPRSQVTRERLLLQVKGESAKRDVLTNLPYVDSVNHRVWYFGSLDTNQNTAKAVSIWQLDDNWHDMYAYFANSGQWNGEFWKLTGVKKIIYSVAGGQEQQKTYEQLDLPDITSTPKELSLIVSQPPQLTVSELSQYIATSTSSQENLAKFRTEWWYRVLYPFSLLVLMLFALLQGARTDRRNALGGIMLSILVLIGFIFTTQFFIAFGAHDRLPPFVAVVASEVIFGAVGLHMLARSNGWWWQLLEVGRRLKKEHWDEEEEPA